MKNMREMGRRWEGDEEQEREGKDERESQRERDTYVQGSQRVTN